MNRMPVQLISLAFAATVLIVGSEAAEPAKEAEVAGAMTAVGLRAGEIPAVLTDVIRPGDTLNVHVPEDSSFDGKYEVRRGGYIIIPKVGRISVAGKTVEAAEAAIRRALIGLLAPKPTMLPLPPVCADETDGRSLGFCDC